MDVKLPTIVRLEWCSNEFLDGVPFADRDEPPRLSADGRIDYIDPVACTMLAAWARHHASLGRPIGIDDSIKSPYTWRIGLLSALAGRLRSAAATEDIVQVTNIREQREIEAFLAKIRGVMHLDEDSSGALVYCFSEFLRNVFEHSRSGCGAFAAASYFRKAGRVTISVADLGVTVPTHVKSAYATERGPEIDDALALRVALEPRVSGSDDPRRNAGLGLYMTRRTADLTGGKFWMLTGGLCARNDGDPEDLGGRGAVDVRAVRNRWEGTVVALTLYPARLRFGSFQRALDAAGTRLTGGRVGQALDFKRKEALPGSTIIRVPPDVSNIAQDKLAAERLREESILPALLSGGTASLDFAGVALTTQSFMHALLAAPIQHLGPADLSRIRFVACSRQVMEIVRMVASFVLESDATS